MAFAADGKIYVGGDFTTYNGAAVGAFAHLNKDGTLDTGFNTGQVGFAHTDASKLMITSIATDTDGDVYVTGRFTSYNGTNAASIVRLNSDGSLDSGFAPPQIEHTASSPGAPIAPSLVKVIGERVFVSGVLDQINTTPNATSASGMAIFSKTGTVDSATTNFQMTNGASNTAATDLALVPDSTDMYVIGSFSSLGGAATRSARVQANGTRSSVYDSDGNPNVGPNNLIYAMAVLSDAKLLLAGNFTQYNGSATAQGLVRVNTDGSLETTFTSPNSSIISPKLAVDAFGKIYVSGAIGLAFGTSESKNFVRLNADGTLDSGFDAVQPNGYFVEVVQSPTGDIYLMYTGDTINYTDGSPKLGDTPVGYLAKVAVTRPTSGSTTDTGTAANVPGKPTNIRVKINGTSAKVSWKVPTTGDAPTMYTAVANLVGVRRSSVTTAKELTCTATAPATSCTIKGLKAGASYGFMVIAGNTGGMSEAATLRTPVLVSSSTPEATDSLPATGSSQSTMVAGIVAILLMAGGLASVVYDACKNSTRFPSGSFTIEIVTPGRTSTGATTTL